MLASDLLVFITFNTYLFDVVISFNKFHFYARSLAEKLYTQFVNFCYFFTFCCCCCCCWLLSMSLHAAFEAVRLLHNWRALCTCIYAYIRKYFIFMRCLYVPTLLLLFPLWYFLFRVCIHTYIHAYIYCCFVGANEVFGGNLACLLSGW